VEDMTKTVTFVTGNKNKLLEVQMMMGGSVEIVSSDIDLPEFQGEPMEIAAKKCITAYEALNSPVIVEDTGLCFNAYGGLPGPYIKWFLHNLRPEGLHKMLFAFEDKTAYAQCIFAYFDGRTMDEPVLFDGRCHGSIVAPAGEAHFGWDPIFKPDGYSETFAQMDRQEKLKISHRGKAFKMLKEYLEQ
jgi:inosine triphosphate pyrophosphatase